MISLILPYWDRQEAADKAFATLEQYAGMDLEVIVVDDGTPIPFRTPPTSLDVRIVRLPEKTEPMAPAPCWNRGVEAARGDIVVLSCVEILHEKPVLQAMADAVREIGPKAYVLAAAWCPEGQVWHCHSTVNPPYNAPGTGQAFCGAMHKSLYWEAGGWDEEYRDGAGYEDCDFINRMLEAGAQFVKRDDLVVIHPKTGAQIAWKPEAFERNRLLYREKWPTIPGYEPVTFVCLKAGEMYGPEYVNILFDMVRRNLPRGFPGKFVCITDNPAGLAEGIQVIDLPADLERWWGKLWMFKRGLFPDGTRMVFMDLDTIIVGNLTEIFNYRGEFATLRDLGGNGTLGPAAILWRAGGMAADYWDRWEAAGRPRNYHGDKGWMEATAYAGEYLQDLYPGAFRSFKLECQTIFPKGTKIVCFHGEPRPHNCNVEWVQQCWKMGGGTAAELEAVCNTITTKIVANVKSSMARKIPTLKMAEHAVIVGGGPSLKTTLDELRRRADSGQTVFAVNGAGKFLLEQGIVPDHIVILDARPENAAFLIPGLHHFLASHCDPWLFEQVTATLYHANTAGVEQGVEGKTAMLVSTGSTVGLVAIGIAHVLGYRNFHLFGMDSSYTDEHHAYPQPLNDQDAVIEVIAAGSTFKCAPWMLLQVQQFQSLATQLANEGCVVTVAGDGLLSHVARELGHLMAMANEPSTT